MKSRKPTGSGTLPRDVKEARNVQKLIDARGGLRNIEDLQTSGVEDNSDNDPDYQSNIIANDVQDHISVNSDEQDEQQLKPSTDSSMKNISLKTEAAVKPKLSEFQSPVHIAQTVHSDAPKTTHKRNSSHANASALIKKIMDTLDSDTQFRRDHSQRHLENIQLLTMTQQLRDATSTIESLRREVTILQDRLNESERRCDRAEMRMEMMQMHHQPPQRSFSKRKYEHIVKYADGGEAHYYIGSDDEDDPYAQTGMWIPSDTPPPMHDSNTSVSQYSFIPAHVNGGCQGDAPIIDSAHA